MNDFSILRRFWGHIKGKLACFRFASYNSVFIHVWTCQPQNFGAAKPRGLSYSPVICIWLNVLPVVYLNQKPCCSCSKGNDNFQNFPTGIVRYTPR